MFSSASSHTKKWQIHSIDVKTAFLQENELEQNVLVRPPKEAQTDKICKLHKCIYGLADASRYWYLKVREELCKLGAKHSKLDRGIFLFQKHNELMGVINLFVDDIMWVGKPIFNSAINKFKTIFHVGAENDKAFTYVSIYIKINIICQSALTKTHMLRV